MIDASLCKFDAFSPIETVKVVFFIYISWWIEIAIGFLFCLLSYLAEITFLFFGLFLSVFEF